MGETFRRGDSEPCRAYQSVHYRLVRDRGPARNYPCSSCAGPASDWAFQYPENRTEICPKTRRRYSTLTEDYAPMCRSCHLRFDWARDPEMAESLSAIRREVTSRPKTEEHLARIWDARRADAEGMRKHSKLMRETMARTNSRRFRCGGCDLVTNAGNLGKHQRATGHIDRKEATS